MSKTTKTKTARRANGTKAKTARKTKTAKTAAPAKAKRTGTKGEMLVAMLTKGATVDAMRKQLGWQAHTLRASISMLGSKQGLKIERTRTDGVTSYKLA
jgi:hypothetical protein